MVELHGLHWPDSIVKKRGMEDAQRHTSSYVNSAERELPRLVKYCRTLQGCVIQAGGHCGAWPAWLARRFPWVYTWEPEAENYRCLRSNIPRNVTARCALLGEAPGTLQFKVNGWNTGGHRGRPRPGDMPVETIDAQGLAPQAIILDVEGMELPALCGAAETIRRHRPVIMLEARSHGTKYGWGEPFGWLKKQGYRLAESVSRDRIYVHEGHR